MADSSTLSGATLNTLVLNGEIQKSSLVVYDWVELEAHLNLTKKIGLTAQSNLKLLDSVSLIKQLEIFMESRISHASKVELNLKKTLENISILSLHDEVTATLKINLHLNSSIQLKSSVFPALRILRRAINRTLNVDFENRVFRMDEKQEALTLANNDNLTSAPERCLFVAFENRSFIADNGRPGQ